MLFTSTIFIIFLTAVIIIFFNIPTKYRSVFLLIASYIFYMYWVPELIFVLLTCTIINYFGAIKISDSKTPATKRLYLILTISFTLLLLFTFKYINFLLETINFISFELYNHQTFSTLNIILPIGISFYSLQGMAYTVDVYRGEIQPERNYLKFSLFLSFFPQLLAGPIARGKNFLPQLNSLKSFDLERFILASKRILWGFFKKIIIADRLSVIVDQIYSNPQNYDGIILLFATYLFAFQIYCDFSGYVDIALGVAKILGINLNENFNNPYKAKSMIDFWHRWHITLSGWFRDYLYIPLGGNRVVKTQWILNILIVFIISGLWHGASWTFIIWGLLHGSFYLLNHLLIKVKGVLKQTTHVLGSFKIPSVIKIFFVFNCVSFAWIFFKADSLSSAVLIVQKIGMSLISLSSINFVHYAELSLKYWGINIYLTLGFLFLFILIENSKYIQLYFSKILNSKYPILDLGLTNLFIISLILFSQEVGKQFIYSQF